MDAATARQVISLPCSGDNYPIFSWMFFSGHFLTVVKETHDVFLQTSFMYFYPCLSEIYFAYGVCKYY